jgi:Zeta toxin
VDEADRYRLSPAQHEKIFREEILPDLTHSTHSAPAPRAVILGGQPGAGKSALQSAVEKEMLGQGGVLSIIGDDLRAYHPQYRRLLAANDKTAAFFTDRDSGQWEKLIAFARDNHFNVLIESTMRVPDKVCGTARDLRDHGYSVDARALAVHTNWSLLGIHQRYEAMLKAHGHARFTLRKSHDDAYKGMLETVDRLQREALADRIAIYRRGNIVIYSYDQEVSGQPAGTARTAIEAERTRPWRVSEKLSHAVSWDKIHQQRVHRRAERAEIAQAKAERSRALLVVHADPLAKTALQRQLAPDLFDRTERFAAAAAFAVLPRPRAMQLFPALRHFYERLDRTDGANANDLRRLIEKSYPNTRQRQGPNFER